MPVDVEEAVGVTVATKGVSATGGGNQWQARGRAIQLEVVTTGRNKECREQATSPTPQHLSTTHRQARINAVWKSHTSPKLRIGGSSKQGSARIQPRKRGSVKAVQALGRGNVEGDSIGEQRGLRDVEVARRGVDVVHGVGVPAEGAVPQQAPQPVARVAQPDARGVGPHEPTRGVQGSPHPQRHPNDGRGGGQAGGTVQIRAERSASTRPR